MSPLAPPPIIIVAFGVGKRERKALSSKFTLGLTEIQAHLVSYLETHIQTDLVPMEFALTYIYLTNYFAYDKIEFLNYLTVDIYFYPCERLTAHLAPSSSLPTLSSFTLSLSHHLLRKVTLAAVQIIQAVCEIWPDCPPACPPE